MRTGPVDKKYFESQPISRSFCDPMNLLCPRAGLTPGILRHPRILNILPGGPAVAPLSVSHVLALFLEGFLLRWEPSPAPPLRPQTCQAGFQSLLTRGRGAGHPSINAENYWKHEMNCLDQQTRSIQDLLFLENSPVDPGWNAETAWLMGKETSLFSCKSNKQLRG